MKGFIIVNVPAHNYNSCRHCDYYNHFMIRSGMNPVYGDNCDNPDLDEMHKLKGIFNGNLPLQDKTPNWCPFIINPWKKQPYKDEK